MSNETVISDGKTQIGAMHFPDRKLPSLCVARGNNVVVFGHFNSDESAVNFMTELAAFFKISEVKEKRPNRN